MSEINHPEKLPRFHPARVAMVLFGLCVGFFSYIVLTAMLWDTSAFLTLSSPEMLVAFGVFIFPIGCAVVCSKLAGFLYSKAPIGRAVLYVLAVVGVFVSSFSLFVFR